jgi:hypothetical protein
MWKRLIELCLLTAGSIFATANVVAAAPVLLEKPAMTPLLPQDSGSLVGTPADIAPTAYQ